jgi:polyisoprenoid-binding protein YceI
MKHYVLTLALAAGLLPAAGAAQAPAWTADLVHSRAEFTVSHMVVSKVWGHIPIRSLALVTPRGSVIPAKIDVVLNVAHEDTDNHDRDADLRSATYFDVAQYPNMTFKSTKVEPNGKSDFTVSGDLTIKNVTKSVTFPAHVEGIIPDKSGVRVGYSGKLTIDRRDWGIVDARLTEAGVLLVGYNVDIGLTVEATSDDKNPLKDR